jgi:hypothetical protein
MNLHCSAHRIQATLIIRSKISRRNKRNLIDDDFSMANKNEMHDELPHDNQPEPGQMLPNLDTETDMHVESDDFVAAIYNRWFIGKIEEIDNADNEILKCHWFTYTFFWIYHGQLVDQFYIRFDHDRSRFHFF